jgi:acyl carrier protein
LEQKKVRVEEVNLKDVIDLLEEVVDLSGVIINSNSVLGEDIPVDSTEMLRIISRIESRYKIKFKVREILNLNTVGDILEATRRNINIRQEIRGHNT